MTTVELVCFLYRSLKIYQKNNNIRWLKTVFSTIWTSRYNHSFEAIIMASKKPRPMIGEHVIIFLDNFLYEFQSHLTRLVLLPIKAKR